MLTRPVFPTKLHQDAAEIVRNYFGNVPETDTILVVNSCARGQAVPESDLDFAILVSPETTTAQINIIDTAWQTFSGSQPAILNYKKTILMLTCIWISLTGIIYRQSWNQVSRVIPLKLKLVTRYSIRRL